MAAAAPGSSYPQANAIEQQPLINYPGSAAQAHLNFDPTGKYKLKFEGAFAAVEVSVSSGDGVKSQGGVMVTMSDNVDLDTQLEGGFGSSLLRCCCAGGSMFFSHFTLMPGSGPRGDVLLAPPVPGEIIMLHMVNDPGWVVQPGGFLACDESVSIGVKMLNLAQGCCGGEGFFVMEAAGRGRLLVCSYGSITRYDLAPGERRKIDNGYCVAWTQGMHWEIGQASRSLVNSFVSGEGLVNKFMGPGTVFVQTRSLGNLANALKPYLPSGGDNNGFSLGNDNNNNSC
ncbi:hypothetical protein PLESTB_001377500 [Pleodorina starrii]|uniref:Altered inheritance of mitochondria protein 24, mitochondrial n=1 Tax=Pleodorina starrii TaxID=330485 RepID=A0A9W6F6T1_9CHLO|nr:hypothetical protein PLESTM_000407600 [Pleodorina starrii]GLC58587.1 hypothetical protein PLESTB_001377500 [Pleodorina starrii]GLC67506.1 hypothetical protein PLESTF_000564900 [Pleodorina starrii]